jgi:hypothetical protein
MAHYAGTSCPEAEATRAAITARLDTLRVDIFGVLEDLQRTADRLLDHVLAEQLPRVRETVEGLAPRLNEALAQGQAATGAVLDQVKRGVPHVAAAQQHPWIVLGSALLVGYLVSGRRAGTPAQPRRPPTPPTSGPP